MLEHDEDTFVTRESETLRRMATRTFRQPQDAEDLVQDTWALLYEHDPEEIEKPPAWLRGTLRNLVFRKLRRERVRRVVETPLEAEPASRAPRTTEEPAVLVERLARRLPSPYREVVDLHYFEGRSIEEIARALGRPRATVKTQLNRSLKLLRRDLLAAGARGPGGRPGGEAGRTRRRSLAGFFALLTGREREATAAAPSPAVLGLVGALVVAVPSLLWLALGPTRTAEVRASEPSLASASGLEPADRLAPLSGERAGPARRPSPATPSPVTEPPTAAGEPSLEILCLATDTQAPVARLPLLLELEATDTTLEPTVLETDEAGRLAFDAAPGPWRITPLVGDTRHVRVSEGASRKVRLTIPPGLPLAGYALERDGEPAPGAAIALSFPGRPEVWHPRAHAAADGGFAVEADPRSYVAAELDGRVSVRWSVGSLHERGTPPHVLVVPTPRPVEGRVLGPTGDPVAGASILTGTRTSLAMDPIWNDEGVLGRLGSHETRSGPDGRFHVHQVSALVQTCRVEAPGFAPWVGSLPAGHVPGLRLVTLEEGVELAGRVLDGGGAPVAGARVRLDFGEGYSPLATTSDGAGRYALGHLPTRTVVLTAEHASRGGTRRELDLSTGGRRLDLELSPSSGVRGRVLDAEGQPLADRPVVARPVELDPEDASRNRGTVVRTDPDGRFRLLLEDGLRHRVAVYPAAQPLVELWNAGGSTPVTHPPLVWQDDVRGGEDELRLVVDAEPARGRVAGELRARPGSLLWLLHDRLDLRFEARLEGGLDDGASGARFTRADLPPGAYRAVLREPRKAEVEVAAFELAPGAELDLGALASPVSGELLVTAKHEGGSIETYVRVMLRDAVADRKPPSLDMEHLPGGTVHIEDLAPGSYWVCVQTRGSATVWEEVEIRSGETARLDVTLIPGQPVRFQVEPEPSLSPSSSFRVRAWSDDGRLLYEGPPEFPPTERGPFPYSARLPRGAIAVELVTEDGRRGSVRVQADRLVGLNLIPLPVH